MTDNPTIRPARPAHDIIAALATIFPQTFTAEKWRPHRPLKIGIHLDLIATGILSQHEAWPALRSYTRRRMYLAAVAAGGPRIDLDGNPAGEVTPAEAAWAQIHNALRSRNGWRASERERRRSWPRTAASLPCPRTLFHLWHQSSLQREERNLTGKGSARPCLGRRTPASQCRGQHRHHHTQEAALGRPPPQSRPRPASQSQPRPTSRAQPRPPQAGLYGRLHAPQTSRSQSSSGLERLKILAGVGSRHRNERRSGAIHCGKKPARERPRSRRRSATMTRVMTSPHRGLIPIRR
jgi:sRNA-binding protein